jgi:hypothetical protein
MVDSAMQGLLMTRRLQADENRAQRTASEKVESTTGNTESKDLAYKLVSAAQFITTDYTC